MTRSEDDKYKLLKIRKMYLSCQYFELKNQLISEISKIQKNIY